MNKLQFDGPVVLVVMDGLGLAPNGPGNAVSIARTDFLNYAARNYHRIAIDASEEAVGLVHGQMGNSEVGHNTMGCGQIIKQGTARINEAFETGEIWQSEAWHGAINQAKKSTLHFSGIFSDGGVHSDIAELEQMITKAVSEGIKRIRLHIIIDGRDVAPQSEPKYIKRFEDFAKRFPDADIKIASGGGRMTTISDRYNNDWGMVERGWNMMFYGISENRFKNATDAITSFRAKDPEIQDQNLPEFVIVDDDNQPVGKVEKGDAFIYYDFRADRAIEIAMAFTYNDFPYFNRGDYRPSDVYFAGLTEYNSDTHVPEHQLIPAISIKNPLNRFISSKGISQLAISETIKFGHITYYFNGNNYEKAPGEEHIKIDSYVDGWDSRPWLKSAEITDVVLDNMDKYKFVRVNYPNGDIIGHYGDLEIGVTAVEAVDIALKRLAKKVDELGGVMVITADHGCVEEIADKDGNAVTSHTTNKIPFIIYDNTKNRDKYSINQSVKNPGLSNVAATIALLLGESDYPTEWNAPLIKL